MLGFGRLIDIDAVPYVSTGPLVDELDIRRPKRAEALAHGWLQ